MSCLPTLPRLRRPQRNTRGFTLVELLLVISILAILAGLALSVLRSAQEDALEARTKTQFERINRLLAGRWDDYEVRVMAIRMRDFTVSGNPLTSLQIRNLRKRVVAELIRVEIPDNTDEIDHVDDFPSPQFISDFGTYMRGTESLVDVMRQRLPSLLRRFVVKVNQAQTASSIDNNDHDGAECLYMILESMVDLNGSGLDVVFQEEIGDTDGDGLKEVLDAWGNPVQFVVDVDTAITTPTDVADITYRLSSVNIPQ